MGFLFPLEDVLEWQLFFYNFWNVFMLFIAMLFIYLFVNWIYMFATLGTVLLQDRNQNK